MVVISVVVGASYRTPIALTKLKRNEHVTWEVKALSAKRKVDGLQKSQNSLVKSAQMRCIQANMVTLQKDKMKINSLTFASTLNPVCPIPT